MGRMRSSQSVLTSSGLIGGENDTTEIALDDIVPKTGLSKIDAKTDEWFTALLESNLDRSSLSPPQAEVLDFLTSSPALSCTEISYHAPPKLAKGCEKYNIPIMRKRAEAWRHFDVDGIVAHDFLSSPPSSLPASLSLPDIKESLEASKLFLPDSEVEARLVYVDDVFVPSLSITSSSSLSVQNSSPSSLPSSLHSYFATLPDGATDDLPYKPTTTRNVIPISKLSGKDHKVGSFNSQSCVNNQQGTASFAALNTIKCSNIALVEIPTEAKLTKPIQVIRASSSPSLDTAIHPRTMVIAGDRSEASIVQTNIDLSSGAAPAPASGGATLFNSYTQVLVGENATISHSYVDESGGIFEGGVENDDNKMEIESQRPELQNTLLESISVHLNGQFASYSNAMISSGGNGRSKVAFSAHLMEENTHVTVKGLCMSGGAQKMDMRTNIHHIASGCTSKQAQRNVIGGRSGTTFKGRIRVEQSAQQTDSDQLVRSLLLNERSRVWCMPSLEIIADDVTCTHGATISDLSEEELFYLRARGLDRETSRNLQLFAFLDDISRGVNPAYLGDEKNGLKARLGERLQRITPKGDRKVKGEFSSV